MLHKRLLFIAVGLVVVLVGYVSFAGYSIQQMRHDNDVRRGADAAGSEAFHQYGDRPLGHTVLNPDDVNIKEQTRRPKSYPQVLRAGAAISDTATTHHQEDDDEEDQNDDDALTDTAPPKKVEERKAEDVVVPATVVAPGSSDPEGGSEGNVQNAIQEDAEENVHAPAKETGVLEKVKVSASVVEEEDDDTEETDEEETDGNNALLLSTPKDFAAHIAALEKAIQKDPEPYRKVITAYIEPPLGDTVPGTGDRGDPEKDKSFGTPPKFVVPLPRRPHGPSHLRRIEYPRVRNCNDMPGHFPIDRGLELDAEGNAVVWNVGNEPTPDDFPEREAPYCPVELDPFLPWIHDVFPSQDGSRIEFIAQNKRRCRTGKLFTENVNRLVPQVALMQPVSVERLSEDQARELAPDLWHPEHEQQQRNSFSVSIGTSGRSLTRRPVHAFHLSVSHHHRDSRRPSAARVLGRNPVGVPLQLRVRQLPQAASVLALTERQRFAIVLGEQSALFLSPARGQE